MDLQNQSLLHQLKLIFELVAAQFPNKQATFQFESDLQGGIDIAAWEPALRELAELAIQNSPNGSTIMTSVIQTQRDIEIEIADAAQQAIPTNAPAIVKARTIAAPIGGRIDVLPCAQGGTAYILSIPRWKIEAAA